jgi:hypothetical protein
MRYQTELAFVLNTIARVEKTNVNQLARLESLEERVAELARKGSSCSRCMAGDMDELYGYKKR